jgi:hypothetical protein
MRWRKITIALAAIAAVAVCAWLLSSPSSAAAATPHPIGGGGPLDAIGGLVSGVFSSLGHAVLGAFTWTIELASKFILITGGALVKLLIPSSWVHKGLQIMGWIVQVPNYAGKIASPGGGSHYGFSGINALRDLFMWLAIAIAPLTLVYATTRAMLGEREPVAIPVLRVLAVAAAIILYPYLWTQGAALADQITHAILNLPAVAHGLNKLMDYAVGGVALGGWQLIDLALMATIGLALLALIFLKVVLILLGALLYATGPLMIGLVATESGAALARAWASAVGMLLGLGIVWAAMFAVGALLIGDAGTAGPLIAGHSDFGTLVGGLLLAVAGLASLWLCLKVAREAMSLLRMQLAGLLVLSRRASSAASGTSSSSAPGRGRTTGQSLREYGSRLARGAAAAGAELAAAIPGGAALSAGGRVVGQVGRRGILGTAAAGARAGASRMAPGAEALVGRSRAGAVAARMARAGTAAWQGGPVTPRSPARPRDASAKNGAASSRKERSQAGTAAYSRRDGQAASPAAARDGGRDGKTQTRTPVGVQPSGSRPGASPGSPGQSNGGRSGAAGPDSARATRATPPPPRSSTRTGAPTPSTPGRAGAGSSPPPARNSTTPRQAPRQQKPSQAPAPSSPPAPSKRSTPPPRQPAPKPAPRPEPRAPRDGSRTPDRGGR